MSSGSFAIALGIGAALLAFWVQYRFPKLAPQDLKWATFHLIATMVLAQFTSTVFRSVELQPLGMMALLFGLALPTLVYAFVAGMWIIRIAQGAMGRGTTH
jgi:uncharacterized membrane protein